MNISVIICTHNRAESLRKTLDSLCSLEIPVGMNWELIVVDNNSSGNIRAVCEEFTGRLPFRCVSESRQGLSLARNRGVRESKGRLVAFTDDDVDVDRRWLAELCKAAQEHPNAGFFGGKSLPHWDVTPPGWVMEHSATLLRGVFVHCDCGDAQFFLPPNDKPTFVGANMAFRSVFLNGNEPFDEALGRQGVELLQGEETEFMMRLVSRGIEGLYVPTAIVYHRAPAERMTERYVRRWFEGFGATRVRRGDAQLGLAIAGISLRFFFFTAKYAVKFALFRWTRPSRVWLRARCRMAENWGILRELRRHASETQ